MKFFPLCLLLALPVFAGAQSARPMRGQPEMYPDVNLKKIFDRPDIIRSKVSSTDEDEKIWISMETDVHVCTGLSMEQLKAAITDYAAYPDIFRRTTESRIISRDEAGVTAFFKLTVKVMRITVVTAYTVLLETAVDEPGKFFLRFSHVSDDGTLRNVQGFWYMEAVEVDGRPSTYLRYASSYDSLKSRMLQRPVTSLFYGSETTGILKELLAAAVRY